MIRALTEADFDFAADLVNDSWRAVYGDYVNPDLLSARGCAERARSLKQDFAARRLEEYVWEEKGRVLGRREILIWAFRENRRALAFYEKHGYQPDREEYLGPPYLTYGVRLIKAAPP